MERRDTQSLLQLKVAENDHRPDLSESIITENSEHEENYFDPEAFKDFREAILREPELRYDYGLDDISNDQMIYVASVDLSQISEEESALLKQQEEAQRKNLEAVAKRNAAIKNLENQAKARLLSQYMDRVKKIKKHDVDEKKGFGKRTKNIRTRFDEARQFLKSIVSTKKRYAQLHIGKLKEKNDMEIIAMDKAKKKLFIRIELCRAVKDKLPCAHFAILVSLWDRLGGTKLEFSKNNRITKPIMHGGRYFNNCLRFEETLELDIPSYSKLTSSMCISFELYLLKNRTVKFDKPVAYSYFPLINSDFQVSEGRFKTTMLKGSMDLSIEKYSDIEAKYRNRIDDWLCNLYFTTKLSEPPEEMQLKLPEDYEQHQFSVTGPDGLKARSQGVKRLKYVMGEVFQDLGFKAKKASYGQLWMTLIILSFSLWICRLTHYFGQWLYLTMCGVDVNKFEVLWFTFTLKYASDLYFKIIIGFIFAGALFTLFIFLIFTTVAFLCYWYAGFFPSIGYRIGVLYGVAMIVDPFVTILESVIISPIEDDWKRDPFLMTLYFRENAGSEFYGPAITFLLYLVIISVSAFVVYNYLVYVHMNGRILDTYNRINSLESAFMVPYDAEVGERYLKWVVKKAHKYKTVEGETRKVACCHYTEKRKSESYSHIAIYNVGKQRSLYRHFMKLANGAIIELSTNRLNMFADNENP